MLPGIGLGLVSASFVLSWAFCGLARRVAPRFGLVDRPGGRKAHQVPTPLGGGVAIWLAIVGVHGLAALVLVLAGPGLAGLPAVLARGAWSKAGELAWIFGLASLLVIVGLIDDRRGLGWKLRLGVQVALAIAFVVVAERATFFLNSKVLTGAVTVLWIVGLTNAFNFLDNMDGLAASVGLIVALLFVGAQVAVGSLFVPATLLVIAGALAGFLVHNRPPARLFMGDAGSNLLGFLLGTLTVVGTFTRGNYSPYGVIAPLLVMAVPLYDTASVILIRLREGRSPFMADRSHFSHRLVDRGLTPARAVATIDLVTLAGGLGALLLHRMTSVLEVGVVVAQTLSVLGLVAVLEVSTSRAEHRDGKAKSQGPLPEPEPEPRSEAGPSRAGLA
jgi:UDP-GlcNAc:undecaprenyl-phosphate GlcNAc-1-phosphate transferase